MTFSFEPARRITFDRGDDLWTPTTIRIWRMTITLNNWHRPLRTKHHLYKPLGPGKGMARPRDGRRFDWDLCLGNGVGPWRILWIYTRGSDGEPLGRTIAWCWRPRQQQPASREPTP